MNEILALATKDLRLLLRDKAGFIFAFIFPLVYAIFFGAIFSGVGRTTSTKLKVAVVDDDQTAESCSFIADLQKTAELDVTTAKRDDAVDSVRRGDRLAYLVLTPGFGERRDGMFWGEPPEIDVGIDPSRQAEAAMLQGLLIKCAFQRMQQMFEQPDVLTERIDRWQQDVREAEDIDPVQRAALSLFFPALKTFIQNGLQGPAPTTTASATDETQPVGMFQGGWQPVRIRQEAVVWRKDALPSSYAWSFPQGIIWGVMGCAAAFGISLVIERTSGTLVRLRMAPITRWQILAGKATACLLTTLGMMITLLLLAAFVFGVYPHSVWLLALAIVSVALSFVGIMMLLSVLGKTEQSAGGIGWAVLLIMAMIGGGMVPRIFMPPWMQTLSHISPVKWGIHAMEGALWRGFSPAEMLFPCAILIAVGVGCFAIGVRAFRWTS
ncbi:MAG: ABC transporter permease [Phycisphaerae bacterium]|jgi:ABC-2 type transport system permease protein